MKSKHILYGIVGIIVGLIGGFIIANSLNRSELTRLAGENQRLKGGNSGGVGEKSSDTLSRAEIDSRLLAAAKDPENFSLQKDLGLALYVYAAQKQDQAMLEQVATLLGRAYSLNSDDYQVAVSYANVNFDLGQYSKDDTRNLRSREIYAAALQKNPKDANVIADYGITFLVAEKPDVTRAIVEIQKALDIRPDHERALEFITKAYLDAGDKESAKKFFARLKTKNPENRRIPDIEERLTN